VLRRVLITIALLCAASVAAPATPADAAPYNPRIPTQTHIHAVAHGAGHNVTLQIRVTANGGGTPKGTLDVTVSPASAAGRAARAASAAPWHTTVAYNGGRISLTGPSVGRGSYVATASFDASRHKFLNSNGLDRFRVGNGAPNDNGNDTDNNGVLPGTGGPDLLWLLLGGGLVVAGAGAVVVARRQRRPASA
jgi:hypothetical protein